MTDDLKRGFYRVKRTTDGFAKLTTTRVYAEDGTYLGTIGEVRDTSPNVNPTGVSVYFGNTAYTFGDVPTEGEEGL